MHVQGRILGKLRKKKGKKQFFFLNSFCFFLFLFVFCKEDVFHRFFSFFFSILSGSFSCSVFHLCFVFPQGAPVLSFCLFFCSFSQFFFFIIIFFLVIFFIPVYFPKADVYYCSSFFFSFLTSSVFFLFSPMVCFFFLFSFSLEHMVILPNHILLSSFFFSLFFFSSFFIVVFLLFSFSSWMWPPWLW